MSLKQYGTLESMGQFSLFMGQPDHGDLINITNDNVPRRPTAHWPPAPAGTLILTNKHVGLTKLGRRRWPSLVRASAASRDGGGTGIRLHISRGGATTSQGGLNALVTIVFLLIVVVNTERPDVWGTREPTCGAVRSQKAVLAYYLKWAVITLWLCTAVGWF